MVSDLIQYSLGLDDNWEFEELSFDEENQRVDVHISHSGDTLVCPETGEHGTLYDHRKLRSWRHLDLLQFKCFIHCRIPRTKSSAGARTIKVPWADISSRVTYAFEHLAIDLLKATKNQTNATKLLRCSFDVINRIMHRSASRGLRRRKLGEIAHVSLDEKSYQRGPKYMTVLGDGERGVFLDVSEGRDLKSAQFVLKRTLRDKIAEVKMVTMDMWKAYISVATTCLSEATLLHDRFHLIQYINKAIGQVRRREVKTHEEHKNSRYALLKNEENRTQKQHEIFKVIQASNYQVSIAWRLREEFKAIFGCDSYADASIYMKLWFESVKEAAVKEVTEIAEMFERHLKGVCNALCHEQSNARAERLNGKIQEVKPLEEGTENSKTLDLQSYSSAVA